MKFYDKQGNKHTSILRTRIANVRSRWINEIDKDRYKEEKVEYSSAYGETIDIVKDININLETGHATVYDLNGNIVTSTSIPMDKRFINGLLWDIDKLSDGITPGDNRRADVTIDSTIFDENVHHRAESILRIDHYVEFPDSQIIEEFSLLINDFICESLKKSPMSYLYEDWLLSLIDGCISRCINYIREMQDNITEHIEQPGSDSSQASDFSHDGFTTDPLMDEFTTVTTTDW